MSELDRKLLEKTEQTNPCRYAINAAVVHTETQLVIVVVHFLMLSNNAVPPVAVVVVQQNVNAQHLGDGHQSGCAAVVVILQLKICHRIRQRLMPIRHFLLLHRTGEFYVSVPPFRVSL